MSSYYESADLKKFGAIGKHAKGLADDFFKYYGAVTGTDGALSKREKALIALAVSHALKCPYCIDAYTTQSPRARRSYCLRDPAEYICQRVKSGCYNE